MPIRCNLQGTLATLGRSSCKITSGRGRKRKSRTIDIADCLYTCQVFNSNKLFGTLTIHLKGHNRYQLYYMVQYMLYMDMYLFKNKSYLSKCHTIKTKHQPSSTIKFHQQKFTPALSIHFPKNFPLFQRKKYLPGGTRCVFFIFFGRFGWLSRRSSAPRSDPIEAHHQSSVTSQVVPVAKSRSNKPSAPDDGSVPWRSETVWSWSWLVDA